MSQSYNIAGLFFMFMGVTNNHGNNDLIMVISCQHGLELENTHYGLHDKMTIVSYGTGQQMNLYV